MKQSLSGSDLLNKPQPGMPTLPQHQWLLSGLLLESAPLCTDFIPVCMYD